MNYLLAIILPPVGVLAAGGGASSLLINIVLTLAGFVPGMVHALFVVHGAEKRKAATPATVIHNYSAPPPQSPTR
jgi:uncharacterized membrane protein YqaE (UPF0057 family)